MAAGSETPHRNRRERAVLAALLLMRPAAVSPDAIADAVWGDNPPPTWGKQIQAVIGRLRTALGTAAIVTVDRAYRLELPRGAVDVDVFEDEIARAATLGHEGEHARAAIALERALGLWRSAEPYDSVADWPPAAVEIARLTELRRQAEDDLLVERLAAGDHRGVAATAAALASAEPLRESRWISLATALYRCERQADALAALRRARQLLLDELGLDPSPALVELEQAILRHDPDLSVAPLVWTPDDRCPYKGLNAYEPGDADVYFGRDADIARAVSTLDRMRFLVLAGASGTGKSSLLRAGVAPALAARGTSMVEVSAAGGAVEAIEHAPAGSTVAIDQFETAFSPALPEGRARAICAALAAHHRRGGRVAIAVRSDHLDACAADPAIGALVLSSLHLVTPLRGDALRAAIEEPARHAHLALEHGFVDVVVADAEAATGALPLLSHALAETWHRREGSTLTIDGYTASGGLRGAVARSAELLFTNLSAEDRHRCAMILRRLVTLTDTGAVVSNPVDIRGLADEDLERVVARLVQARLVGSREHHLELAHESLVHAWPRLQGWLESDIEGQRVLGHLSTAAVTWDSLGRPDAELARGPRLALAWDWAHRGEGALTPLERAFLVASRAQEAAEQAAGEDAARRESRARARVRRMRRWAVAAAFAALVGLVAATVAYQVAERRRDTADEQTEIAQLEGITKDFAKVMDHSRTLGLLLAAEAYMEWKDAPVTQGALLAALASEPGYMGELFIDHVAEDRPPHVAMVGDGFDALLASWHGLELRDLASGELRKAFVSSVRWAWPTSPRVAVSADRSRAVMVSLASETKASGDGRLMLASYDVSSGTELAAVEIGGAGTRVGALAVSPDGTYAALVDARTGDLTVRDVATGRAVSATEAGRQRSVLLDRPGAVAFLDPDTALFTTLDGSVLVTDAASGRVERSLEAPARHANTAVERIDGNTVVAAGDEGLVALSLDSGRVLWTRDHVLPEPGACQALVVAAASGTVLCGSGSGVIRGYDLATGTPTGPTRTTQQGGISTLGIDEAGTVLAAVSSDAHVISRWSLDGSGPISHVIAADRQAVGRWSADGTQLITVRRDPVANTDGELTGYRVWDVAADAPVAGLPRDLDDLAWFGENRVIGLSPVTGTRDVYDTVTGTLIAEDVVLVDASSVAISADWNRAYALVGDTVETYDTATLRRVGPVIRTLGRATHLSAAADGALLAITSRLDYGHVTQIIDGATGVMVGLPRTSWRDAVLAPDGSGVAIHDRTQAVKRFDTARVEAPESIPAGGPIDAIELSADGSRLLLSARDGTVSLYDARDAESIGTPLAANSPGTVAGLLSPDGLALAVNVEHGVAVWDIDPEHMLTAACAAAGRNLSSSEWTAYLEGFGERRGTCEQYSEYSGW